MTLLWPQYLSDPIEVYANNPAVVKLKFILANASSVDVTTWSSWTAVLQAVSDTAVSYAMTVDSSEAASGFIFLNLSGEQTLEMSTKSRGWNFFVRVTLPEGPTTILDGLLNIQS